MTARRRPSRGALLDGSVRISRSPPRHGRRLADGDQQMVVQRILKEVSGRLNDVTITTIDTTIPHIIVQPKDIKIKQSKFRNPIQLPATVLNSNGHEMCIRAPFWVSEYLMGVPQPFS
ncbi:hypothetical protein [Oryza sativa Japonica Group]|uniref:Uncharacterized protein n=1 Tax=Oryza sativa subsp. japonica TaxID=39947 RepID=Q5VNY1_ORYSJ|nr:hypothetical protein [Oryza sativa Japonica Group]